jgi:hypothetical protein
LAPASGAGVGPGLGRSHLNSAVELGSSDPTLRYGRLLVVAQWLIDFSAGAQVDETKRWKVYDQMSDAANELLEELDVNVFIRNLCVSPLLT